MSAAVSPDGVALRILEDLARSGALELLTLLTNAGAIVRPRLDIATKTVSVEACSGPGPSPLGAAGAAASEAMQQLLLRGVASKDRQAIEAALAQGRARARLLLEDYEAGVADELPLGRSRCLSEEVVGAHSAATQHVANDESDESNSVDTGADSKLSARLRTASAETEKLEDVDVPARLCDAARHGDITALKRLVRWGADVTAVDYDQRTALHLAAAEGREHCVRYLLKHGADVNARDRWGATSLHEAVREGRDKVALLLTVYGGTCEADEATTSTKLCEAARRGSLADIRAMVAGGASISAADYDSRTALHLAASEGHLTVVTFLLLHGADASAADRWGGTALDDAEREHYGDVAQALRDAGAVSGSTNLRPSANVDAPRFVRSNSAACAIS
ncbi:ankyrin repeat-containing domain protein [Pelagophyceae sp. CCMP2097]|nr:ankyrin repeat-containing domain protein [Pelagophyceae sp. CCMP2097]|mmetsp:Transcript_23648/g.79805  ORF Transcript_23648/g.79805 Transcript_23648/m.79805 type:complete len:394 (-) Transcript_23648:1321-2502(-)